VAWILDLDGVVWLSEQPIPGSAQAISGLRAAGERVLFLTNNSAATVREYTEKLETHGVPVSDGDLVTSAQAVATLVHPGEVALLCAGPGVEEALRARGATVVREGGADCVVVGWHVDFDYKRLTAAAAAVRAGARLLATNDDATYPTPDGLIPGGGAILAAVVTASAATATVAGKPNEPMADLVRNRLGDALGASTVVGDRPSTDGLMARRLGARFALVLTGVTAKDDLPVTPSPDVVADDLAALVAERYIPPRGA
jgi:4-nitrophenyl phosphatase